MELSFLAIHRSSYCINLKENKFIKFKEECLKVGTTEEALAVAEKNGYNTVICRHPFIKDKKIPIFVQILY